jgi:hypothetical protein
MDKTYKLPQMELKFKIQTKGKETQINWAGEFMYRRPTLGERSLIENMRARLSGDLRTIDQDVDYVNTAIAHLRYTLREYPDWWKDTGWGLQLYDTNIVLEIYDRCIEFENDWAKKVGLGNPDDVAVPTEPSEVDSAQATV